MFKMKSIALAVLGAGLTGCASLGGLVGGGSQGPSESAAGTASVTAGANTTAGDYKPPKSDVVVEAGRPEHLSTGTVLIVPTAYVTLPVSGKVAVSEQGSAWATIGGGSSNSVKASAQFKVSGLDKALAQKIAKAAYDDFVKQLRATGYTVLAYEDIKDRDVVRNADRRDKDSEWGMPIDKVFGGSSTALLAAPSDEQAFEWGMNGGVFNQFISLGKTKMTDGIIVIPQYSITAPQMWGEKAQTYSTISAAVKGAPAMVLASASATWLTNKPKVEMGGGPATGVHLKGMTSLSVDVGELVMVEDTTSGAANAISKTLGFLSGTGSITSQSARYEMAIDRAAYEAAAVQGITRFNAEVAKIAARQKPAS